MKPSGDELAPNETLQLTPTSPAQNLGVIRKGKIQRAIDVEN
jgi:hypothetical protein